MGRASNFYPTDINSLGVHAIDSFPSINTEQISSSDWTLFTYIVVVTSSVTSSPSFVCLNPHFALVALKKEMKSKSGLTDIRFPFSLSHIFLGIQGRHRK